jgi:L-lactate dehydrogenase complex protein LldE
VHQEHLPTTPRPPGERPRVALFVTCLTETFAPRAAIAVVKVLEHLGCDVGFPRDQTCCGQPMYNNGFHTEAAAIARRMIGVFEGWPLVVTPSGSCAAMVRAHFPSLLEHDAAWAPRARALAEKTYEFSQFLMDVLDVDLKGLGVSWGGRAAYHPSCHLRSIGMHERAATPLRQIGGFALTPLDNADQCCGFGGAFSVKQPEISGALARDKVEAVRRSGAGSLVCNDAGCSMNIEGACRRAGVPVRMLTTAEIVAEGLGLMPREDER